MPPIRNPSTVKLQKTERTHEENQERAYIAASRRSDRSLEARIESARRASEIHKKRTGRALRVTEQDVINEEMYEEEDNDLPASYRRFAQHLQNNHLFLDGKFESYMIANLATRQAMLNQYWASRGFGNPNSPPQDCSITDQNAPIPGQNFNRHPTSPRYANPLHFAYQNLPPSTTSPVQAKQESQSPFTNCQPPYPPQGNWLAPQRSALTSTPQSSAYPANLPMDLIGQISLEEQRRMSLPVQSFQNAPLTTTISEATSQQQSADQTPFNPHPSYFDSATHIPNFSPLSVNLPLNQQQIIDFAFSPTSPSTQILMAGNEGMPQPFLYNYDPDEPAKSADMNQTLASNTLEVIPTNEENPTFTASHSSPSTNTAGYFQAPAWPQNQTSFGFDDSVGAWLPQNLDDSSHEETGLA